MAPENKDDAETETAPAAMPNMPQMPKIGLKISFDNLPAKIMHTLREYKRVITVSKKPDVEDIVKISKVAGLGIILIGVIGFVIQFAFQLVLGR